MTFKELKEIIEKNNIPEDVHFMSDSGWGAWETEMDGIYYNSTTNTIMFTQYVSEYNKYHKDTEWKALNDDETI